jgi:tetratricopeptide (TPR) repeat protein/transcriptional regulator with XRE-family HTH domain
MRLVAFDAARQPGSQKAAMTESERAGGAVRQPAATALGALLRLYRHRALLTQADLARSSGVSERAIRNLESGASQPRYSSVRLLARALGLNGAEYEGLTGLVGGADPAGPGQDRGPGAGPGTALSRLAVPVVPAQLPADVTSFVGRSAELARLDALPGADRPGGTALANVSGAAGIGKTALALHWAHRSAGRFPDGLLYANLQGFGAQDAVPAEPALVLARFIRGLGGDAAAIPDDPDERSALYRSLIHGRRVLIVLDDAVSERQVRPLLPAAPGCQVLVTSRIRLAALDGVQVVDLDALEPGQALELFARVAGPQRVAAEPAAAAQIVRLCGGLPLAVQIAAARLVAHPHWSVGLLAGRLAGEQHRLDELAIGDLEVRSSFACTYRYLAPPQRTLFRRLGLLPGTDFADWVAMPLLGVPAASATALTESLAGMRLLETAGTSDGTGGPARYRIPDLLRIFARERAAAEETEEELAAALARLQGMWLQLAEQADARLEAGQQLARVGRSGAVRWEPGGHVTDQLLRDPSAWLESERPALVAAVLQASELGLHEHAWDLACCLSRFLEGRWYMDDWRLALTAALTAARAAGDRRGEANLLRAMGEMLNDRDRYAEAVDCFRAAAEIFDALGEDVASAQARRGLSTAHCMLGQFSTAIEHLEPAIGLFRTAGETAALASAMYNLGAVQKMMGRHAGAHESYRESLALFRRLEDTANEALLLCSLGSLMTAMGNAAQAGAYLTESLAICEATAHRFGEIYAHLHLGELRTQTGDWPAAREHLTTALSYSLLAADRFGQAASLRGLGELAQQEGDSAAAMSQLAKALAIYNDDGIELWQARTLEGMGAVASAIGDREAAQALRGNAHELFAKLGVPRTESLIPVLEQSNGDHPG